MLPKDFKQNGAHELFMNTYVVVVGQRYYYIDDDMSTKRMPTKRMPIKNL